MNEDEVNIKEDKVNIKQDKVNIIGPILVGSIIVIGLVLLLMSMITIPAGNRGVLLTWGQVTGTLKEGLHFITPFAQQVQIMSVQTQKYETDASAASRDLQDVTTKLAVNYHVAPEVVADLYRDVGLDFQSRVIQPAVQESLKASTAQYNADQLITQRELVKQKTQEELRSRLSRYRIELESISITDFDFSAEFNQAIEAKVTAEQNALKARNDLERVKLESEQQITRARAEAESLRIQSEELSKSNEVLTLRWIEKWNGELPQVMSNPNLLIGLNLNKTP